MHKFIKNKYYKWYFSIITKTKQRGWTKKNAPCYVENHHIKPKSLGGNNSPLNLVCLTAKEHYICHKLLTKFTIKENKWKMIRAFHKMFISSTKQKRIYRARDYAYYKPLFSTAQSNISKGKTYEQRYGIETAKKLKEQRRQAQLGISKSEISKEKNRQWHLGKKASIKTLAIISKQKLGRKWYNDGNNEFFSHTPGKNWIVGRIKN